MSLATPPDGLIVVALVAVALLAGMTIGRWLEARTIDRIAQATLDELTARQEADDRAALNALPPGVSAAEAWELAGRRGISIAEAAELLFVTHARARLAANLERHGHRRPRP